jgi:hypothetical protein
VEEKRDPQEVAQQLLETLNKLEAELSYPSPISALLNSYETSSDGSEDSWEQERSHPTLQYKYRPINLYFERKSTTKTQTIGTSTETIQSKTVAARIANKKGSKRPYLGVTRQVISGLLDIQREMEEHKKTWKMPQLSESVRNCVQKMQQIGKAIQQITLLRRCFFPRRDVIKWESI